MDYVIVYNIALVIRFFIRKMTGLSIVVILSVVLYNKYLTNKYKVMVRCNNVNMTVLGLVLALLNPICILMVAATYVRGNDDGDTTSKPST
jgi:hypothetical protein